MTRTKSITCGRYCPLLVAGITSLCLNVFFTAFQFSLNTMPGEIITRRVRQAFVNGNLVEYDYLPYDTHVGWHQYNDCLILQMITNLDTSSFGRALGPLLYQADASGADMCRTLRDLVVQGLEPTTYLHSRHTRYWLGQLPLTALLLSMMDLEVVRSILRIIVYASILFLLLTGLKHPELLPLAAVIATVGALFWGLPYFGQSLSHALADTTVMIGLACLIIWNQKLNSLTTLLPFCAAFGAMVVYFEMLTGPLPTAAGFLFPTVYMISRTRDGSGDHPVNHLAVGAMALAAFALGAILTISLKVILAAALVQPSGLDVFLANLRLYTKPLEVDSMFPSFLHPVARLVKKGVLLTYGNIPGLIALYLSSILAWFTAGWLARKGDSIRAQVDLAAFAIGASSVPIWTLILPTHTYIHAGFMARILIVPIALGYSALIWQLRLEWN